MGNKKILMIAYHFPPDIAVGAIRPSRFVKYLPDFGYEPYVITVKGKYYGKKSTNYGNPDNVFRTAMFPSLNSIYLRIKSLCYKANKSEQLIETKIAQDFLEKKNQKDVGFAKIKRLINSLCWLPDDRLGWLPFGFLKALTLIERENIRYVMTTSPPHSVHLMGLLLKKYSNIKWVADFRDPWCLTFHKKMMSARSRFSERMERKMEKMVIESADKVVFVTERLRRGYEELYPYVDRQKLETLTNGYDPEDFKDIVIKEKYKKLTFTYTGNLYYGRSPDNFFKAMSGLIKDSKINKEVLEIKLVGNCKYAEGISVKEMAKKYNIDSIVRILDPIPYKEALELMVCSHVLLLFAPDQYYQIPAKAYEYTASGSDIIAFTPDGATRDLITNYSRGIIVAPDNILQIKEAILGCYNRYISMNNITPTDLDENTYNKDAYLKKFSSKELTGRLVSILSNS
ncbi:MAG: glycosyltransferase family 4 protein [Thermodesulfobacteriota bacterium]|nr:glycosyltransferase family 4 protein [Thermodesulfobacteriota bacterium]